VHVVAVAVGTQFIVYVCPVIGLVATTVRA
jgi:hypothetical protein